MFCVLSPLRCELIYSERGEKLGFRVVVVGMAIVMVRLAKLQAACT
jgi:hypothetical protein